MLYGMQDSKVRVMLRWCGLSPSCDFRLRRRLEQVTHAWVSSAVTAESRDKRATAKAKNALKRDMCGCTDTST